LKNKREIVEQTRLAFEFIEKLYLEASYLVKEIEGMLAEEEEKFIIGRPSGYGVTTRSSTGLEPNFVRLWLLKKFGVFFVEEEKTELKSGQTSTPLSKETRLLYTRLVLEDPKYAEPVIMSGVLYGIEKKPNVKWTKFEHAMAHFEYKDEKIFQSSDAIDYEDAYMTLKGQLRTANLFDINNSEDIRTVIVDPALKIYRSIGII
jgi:hypothetical protein